MNLNLSNKKWVGWLLLLIFFCFPIAIPRNYFVYTVGMFVGTIATLGCGYVLSKYYRAKKYWTATRGTIISVNEDSTTAWAGNAPTDIYNPVIRFVSNEGKEYTVTSSEGSSLSDYPEGTWINIYYDPTDPNKIMMDDGTLIGINFLFFIAGLALLIVFNILIVVHAEYLR